LGVLGSLAGGAAGVAKAVNDSKAAQRQLEEMQLYNHAMEGRGLYLTPTNVQLEELARRMHIPFFRGVFMRNNLPISGIRRNENGIVNLDNFEGPGTHWVAYAKRGDRVVYFDSFGNLRPPKELVKYFGNVSKIEYNHTSYQNYNQSICGQLCLRFLKTIKFKA